MRMWSSDCHRPPASPKAVRGRPTAWRLCVGLFRALLLTTAVLPYAAAATVPTGIWMAEDGRAAIELFACGGLACGRIRWMSVPRDKTGALDRDRRNPDPALRSRLLCGLTILWNLHPDDRDGWVGGWLYNPRDGRTYHVTARQQSADTIAARVYVLHPLFGRTEILTRTQRSLSPTCE